MSSEEQLAAKIKADFETLYGSRLKQTEDRLHGAQRINEKLQRDLAAAQAAKPVTAATSGADPWAGIENGPLWRAEIERVATQKANEIVQQREAEQQAVNASVTQQRIWLESRDKVEAKYPDLHHETGVTDSVVAKAFLGVMAQHPEWWFRGMDGSTTWVNPHGPLLTMYEMEEQLKTAATGNPGKTTVNAKSRLSTLTSTPSRATPAMHQIILTREQKTFCDRNNVPYESFLKNATALEQTASVEA